MNLNKTRNIRLTQIEPRSCNYCCHGKAIITTYSECVAVTIGIHHAMRMHHIVTRPARLYNIFPHYLVTSMTFEGKYY